MGKLIGGADHGHMVAGQFDGYHPQGEATMTGDVLHGMTHFRGPDVEINSNGAGLSLKETSGENDYMNNATGQRTDLSGKLSASGSGASTSPEFVDTKTGQATSGVNRSTNTQARQGGKTSSFSAVKGQSLVDRSGKSTDIGNTSMGSTMQNVATTGQKAVAQGGSYDQMAATGKAAADAGLPVSSDLQSGIAEGQAFSKKNNFAPINKGH